MRMTLVPAAAAALMALTPLAAMAHTTGYYSNAVVKSVNPGGLRITLKNGQPLHLAYMAQAQTFKAGHHYFINWASENGGRVITNAKSVG